MKILFVEPEFPINRKSKNHRNFLPIGLLKLYEYYRNLGYQVKLIRGNRSKDEIGNRFKPNRIMITSLFTYWSKYVWETVDFYRNSYPNADITIGGIYASLMENHPSFKKNLKKYNANAFFGVHEKAEEYAINNELDYSILENPHPIDYQIIHASRGCPRNCDFCGTWKIEPIFKSKGSIKNEINQKKLVFYDNNLLANKNIEDILDEIIELVNKRSIDWSESQSGFDGRNLEKNPEIAIKLKKARFRTPRLAWDGRYDNYKKIKKQIDILVNGGYRLHDIQIFMIYNCDIPFKETEMKRLKCWRWKVQISDCRYRPLDQTFDDYNPYRLNQTNIDYYIHEISGWTDAQVKQFRKNVRRQNICVRHGFLYYSYAYERKDFNQIIMRKTKKMKTKNEIIAYLEKKKIDCWFPDHITYPGDS